MTDNGACYAAFVFRDACKPLGLHHIRTTPFTLRTNGKAKRFLKTIIIQWAYARAYSSSDQRAAALPIWTYLHSWHHLHGGLNAKPPVSVLKLPTNNQLRFTIILWLGVG